MQVSRFHTFDLASEKPELQEIEGKPLVSIRISRVAYEITENTLNVNTPRLTIYVGPQSAMDGADPQARAIGNIPPALAGTTVAEAEVEMTADGEDILADFMKDYSTPFNIIVGGDVSLAAGDPVPTGRLVAVVKAEATAGL